MSRLLDVLVNACEKNGAIRLDRYMQLAAFHPHFGYYRQKSADSVIGRHGDFITAPEISQLFGEILGLWVVLTYRLLGQPSTLELVEMGPGRGTLLQDIDRVIRNHPPLRKALSYTLMETSPSLRQYQQQYLRLSAPVSWRPVAATGGPILVIANEVLDCAPIRQWRCQQGEWQELWLIFSKLQTRRQWRPAQPSHAHSLQKSFGSANDAIVEASVGANVLARQIAAWVQRRQGAALICDYGHPDSSLGDSLQAILSHRSVDPLAAPGVADLSAWVRFHQCQRLINRRPPFPQPLLSQRQFLLNFGLEQRFAWLWQQASHDRQRQQLRTGYERLTDPDNMGKRFFVWQFASQQLSY